MIKGPKGSVPTTRGWVSPRGELLKSQKITQTQLDEYNCIETEAPQMLRESPVANELLSEALPVVKKAKKKKKSAIKNLFG